MDINIQNLTKQQILTGYRNGTIKPANDGKYWTEEDRLQLVSMYRGGVCISDMAIHFERKERGITQQLEVLGESQCLLVRNPARINRRSAYVENAKLKIVYTEPVRKRMWVVRRFLDLRSILKQLRLP